MSKKSLKIKKIKKGNIKVTKFFGKYLQEFKKNKKKRTSLIVLLLLILLTIFLYKNIGLFIVASVNGKPITRLALVKELEKQGGKQVLESIITKQTILGEASKKKIVISDKELSDKIDEVKSSLEKQGTNLENVLTYQNQSMEDFKDSIKMRLIIERLLSDKVNVSDEEVKEYYDKNKNMFDKTKTFEELKDDIKEQVYQGKLSQEYKRWIQDIRSSAKINYFVNF